MPSADADAFVAWLERSASMAPDPDRTSPVSSVDPGDDHLLALAADQRAVLVSGDRHLIALAEDVPVFPPARFLAMLTEW